MKSLIRRAIPQSIARQLQFQSNQRRPVDHSKPYDYANQPDDVPSLHVWVRLKWWRDHSVKAGATT